ncbi:MAG: hypothetical protein DRJ43_03605, partial [Thermoprotei archaeon]
MKRIMEDTVKPEASYHSQGALRHSTIQRRPESLLENWCELIKLKNGLTLRAPGELRREAEKFLAWLRSRRSYSPNSLHRYILEFRKLCAYMALRGRHPRQLAFDDYMEMRSAGVVRTPEVVKLYLKFLYEATEDERYMRLYKKIRDPKSKPPLPE